MAGRAVSRAPGRVRAGPRGAPGVEGLLAQFPALREGSCWPAWAYPARPAIEDEAVQAERGLGRSPGSSAAGRGRSSRSSPRPWQGWCRLTPHISARPAFEDERPSGANGVWGGAPGSWLRAVVAPRESPRPWQGWCRPTRAIQPVRRRTSAFSATGSGRSPRELGCGPCGAGHAVPAPAGRAGPGGHGHRAPECDLRRSGPGDWAAWLPVSSMGEVSAAQSRVPAQQCHPAPGGEPSCLVPSGTSSSSTASAPRSARRARRASTTRPAPTISSSRRSGSCCAATRTWTPRRSTRSPSPRPRRSATRA